MFNIVKNGLAATLESTSVYFDTLNRKIWMKKMRVDTFAIGVSCSTIFNTFLNIVFGISENNT